MAAKLISFYYIYNYFVNKNTITNGITSFLTQKNNNM